MSLPALTEQDWFRSADPIALLEHVFPMHGFHSTPEQPRKLRLYYAACGRRAYRRLDAIQRGLLEAAELLADGLLPNGCLPDILEMCEDTANGIKFETQELRKLGDLVGCDPRGWENKNPIEDLNERQDLGCLIFQPFHDIIPATTRISRPLHSADIVREVFPNPFRMPWWQNEWRTVNTTGIAKKMYESRRFQAMGELADALEESGCQDQHILLHCREQNEQHYRGCWVVDWILDTKNDYLGLQ